MKADFICVFNIETKKIEEVKHNKLVENNSLISASEWANFLVKYTDVINEALQSYGIYKVNDNDFTELAIGLYLIMKKLALYTFNDKDITDILDIEDPDKSMSGFYHWYFSLKTLTFSWHPEEYNDNWDIITDTLLDYEFIPLFAWRSFVGKLRFGNLIPNYMSNKQAYRKARDIFLKEYNINRKEFLYGYEE